MRFTTIKARWAKKILRAKYFVVLTDKESVIAIDGADPDSFTDLLGLSSQQAEIEMFYNKLGSLVKDHKLAIDKLTGVQDVKKGRSTTSTKRVQTRIRRNKTTKTKNSKG